MRTYFSLAITFLLIQAVAIGQPTDKAQDNPLANFSLVIQNVGLFDGYDDKGIVHIGINEDTIAAISTKPLSGDSAIDASGKYLIPGLVNAHVHASKMEDLQAGYPLGILTLLNMHTGLEQRELEWKQLSKDSIGFSTLYGAGHAAAVPGGHPTQFSPDMETINSGMKPAQWIANRIDNQVDYIKIIHDEGGFLGSPTTPTLGYDTIEQIITLAHEAGYKAVVHISTAAAMEKIAKFKPDGFVHMPMDKADYPLSKSYYEAIAASDAFVIPTAGIMQKPIEQMLPPHLAKWIRANIMSTAELADVIKNMHEHGIMIVAGTDAQERQMNFAEDYYLELDVYKQAGLSNVEVLRTATGNAAKAFDLPIGEIKVGAKANMVLLDGSPIDDVENLKKVVQVWKNGLSQN